MRMLRRREPRQGDKGLDRARSKQRLLTRGLAWSLGCCSSLLLRPHTIVGVDSSHSYVSLMAVVPLQEETCRWDGNGPLLSPGVCLRRSIIALVHLTRRYPPCFVFIAVPRSALS